MTDQAVIQVDSLCKVYRNGLLRRRRLEVLKELSFEIHPGEVFGLLGPNGAGKTTFMKILLGIVRKSAGTATLLGHPAGDRRSRCRVGFLPENLRIPRHHTGLTAMHYYGKLSGLSRSRIRERSGELLETVGLADRARDGVAKYSKGMLQRLGLAQSLLHDPQVVMLDEPTDGLDPVGRAQVRRIMQQLKEQGKTVLVNSHLLQEMELVCDRVAILDKGNLRYVGPVKDAAVAADGDVARGLEQPDLHLELIGEDAKIRAALYGTEVAKWELSPAGQLSVALRSVSQADADHCVDQLRQQGVSIVSLARERKTLEDVFLAIVAETVE